VKLDSAFARSAERILGQSQDRSVSEGQVFDLQWVDAPPKPSGRGRKRISIWLVRLEPLVHRPMAWARLGSFGYSTADRLRTHEFLMPPGDWEFTTRRNGQRRGYCDIYARYLGPGATL